MIANGAPIIARNLLADRCQAPIDGGRRLRDGHPVLGASKTWRGVAAALLMTPAAALMVGLSASTGFVVGAGAMAGDLCSSFVKRRMNRPVSSQVVGLDQIPEAAIPLLLVAPALSLSPLRIAVVTALFFLGGLVLSKLLYRLKIRQRPY